ncbi:MAG TPA: hypothetical protein VGH27_15470 [Streptosporangiaceae bacterium]
MGTGLPGTNVGNAFAGPAAISQDGSEVFVTGYGATKTYSRGLGGPASYGTVAYQP